MATALLNVLPAPVVFNVLDFVPIDRDSLYGTTTIDGVKHYVTYGGGPEGGYVFLPRQGLHKWHRDWLKEARTRTGRFSYKRGRLRRNRSASV